MSRLRPGTWVKVKISSLGSSSSKGSKSIGAFTCWHHGIVSQVTVEGNVTVVHFCLPDPEQAQQNSPAVRQIRETSLEWFLANGTDAQVVDAEPAFVYDDVVHRARQYLGAGDYSLPTRNCEHFASWCYEGSAFSRQMHAFGSGAILVSVCVGILGALAMNMARSRWV